MTLRRNASRDISANKKLCCANLRRSESRRQTIGLRICGKRLRISIRRRMYNRPRFKLVVCEIFLSYYFPILSMLQCLQQTLNLFQSIDFRLRKMEESAEQILSTLAVIHRFMSAHTSIPDNLQGSMVNIAMPGETPRLRTTSVSEAENPNTLHVVHRSNSSTT